jgi:putative endonuclease
MFFTYILISKLDNSYYVGSTNNLENRLKKHNSGFVKSTKAKVPWELVYSEKYDNLSSVRVRESQIKSWKSRLAIERLIVRH